MLKICLRVNWIPYIYFKFSSYKFKLRFKNLNYSFSKVLICIRLFYFDCDSFVNGHIFMNTFNFSYSYWFVFIREKQIK